MPIFYSAGAKRGRPKKCNKIMHTNTTQKPTNKSILTELEYNKTIDNTVYCNIKRYRYLSKIYKRMVDAPKITKCSYQHRITLKNYMAIDKNTQTTEGFYSKLYAQYRTISRYFHAYHIQFVNNIILDSHDDLKAYNMLNNQEKDIFVDLLKKISSVMQKHSLIL